MLAVAAFAPYTIEASPNPNPASSEQCPPGYVCEATNCKAEYYDTGKKQWDRIEGIAIYKNQNGDIIAHIPGHGNLRTYTFTEYKAYSRKGLAVDINGHRYEIIGYSRF